MNFEDVLSSMPFEQQFEVSDTQYDNFMMFRYELQTIFQKQLYLDEPLKSRFLLGNQPLSKKHGRQIKEMNKEAKDNCIDMYIPPGIVKQRATSVN
jgi:hypothetical protein